MLEQTLKAACSKHGPFLGSRKERERGMFRRRVQKSSGGSACLGDRLKGAWFYKSKGQPIGQ